MDQRSEVPPLIATPSPPSFYTGLDGTKTRAAVEKPNPQVLGSPINPHDCVRP